MLSTKSQQMVLERHRGDTLVQIARRHGVTDPRVVAVVRDAYKFVDRVQRELMTAKPDEVCLYLIPYGEDVRPEDFRSAGEFFVWLCARLRDRGLNIKTTTHRAHNGFGMELKVIQNGEST